MSLSRILESRKFMSPPLLVSSLNIKSRSPKEIETIIVNAGTIMREIRQAISPGGAYQEPFDPPLEIFLHTEISVSIRYRGAFNRAVSISLDPNTVLRETRTTDDGQQAYCKTEGDVDVSLGVQLLPANSNKSLDSCPSFRILIIGETGVGKSSLVNRVFGISGVGIDDTERIKTNVNQEYVALNNDGFVIHDSCGFKSGDPTNLDATCDFISVRRKQTDLKDQLHAIWLCLEIPYAGARLVEAGAHIFLKDKQAVLGDIPLLVVFTKLDLLENMIRAEALRERQLLSDETLTERKRGRLETYCFAPVQSMTKSRHFPHVIVSATKGYESSLNELVEETARMIHRYFRSLDEREKEKTRFRYSYMISYRTE